MKKVLVILFLIVLCGGMTVEAAPFGYSGTMQSTSPYRSNGYASSYSGSSYRHTSYGGYTHAPQTTMRSTSGMLGGGYQSTRSSRGIQQAAVTGVPVRMAYTSATMVRGGVTAGQTYAAMNSPQYAGPRKSGPGSMEGLGDGIGCKDDDDDGKCDYCGHDYDELDEHCATCEELYGNCRCPIGWDWTVGLFTAALAAAYAVKKRCTVTSVMATTCERE